MGLLKFHIIYYTTLFSVINLSQTPNIFANVKDVATLFRNQIYCLI